MGVRPQYRTRRYGWRTLWRGFSFQCSPRWRPVSIIRWSDQRLVPRVLYGQIGHALLILFDRQGAGKQVLDQPHFLALRIAVGMERIQREWW